MLKLFMRQTFVYVNVKIIHETDLLICKCYDFYLRQTLADIGVKIMTTFG